jgi:hypothetical protein
MTDRALGLVTVGTSRASIYILPVKIPFPAILFFIQDAQLRSEARD